MQCPSPGLLGASGGFPQVIIQDRRCHRFWSVDEEADMLLLSSPVLVGLSRARACFQTRFRQAAIFKCEAERGGDVLDGRERVIKSRVQAEGIIMLGISGERWHGGSAGGRKEEEKRWKTGLEG